MPYFKIPIEEIDTGQLHPSTGHDSSAKDSTTKEDDGEVDFLSLPESGPYREEDIPLLRARLLKRNADMLSGAPETLPPLREVNHKITLIDESCRYNYYMPRCPEGLKNQLSEKLG